MLKEYLGQGKRGIVYKATSKGKPIVLKVENPKSKAYARIDNEAYWLKRLNKYNIGPKFIKFEDNTLTREFVNGDEIINWIKKNKKQKIKNILKKLFDQCKTMDKLKVNKLEMHKPVKHIIVSKNNPIMIDFERCYKTDKPKNVTQFSQFLMSNNLSTILNEKGITFDDKEIIKANKTYKNLQNKKNYILVLKAFNLPNS